MAQDRWPELCRLVENDDGLRTRDGVGPWTEDKLHFWNGYVHITTTAMVGRRKWTGGVVYVDLFAGPGVCVLSESNRRIPGSPLIAAYAPKPFRKILVCERDPELAEACRKRLAATPAADQFEVFVGDCNERIGDIVAAIPPRALTLAFVDPTGLHVHFDTIAELSRCGRVDLLILFADGVDIARNVELYDSQGSNSNLDRFLGSDLNWRDHWAQLQTWNPVNVRNLFADLYKDQLEKHLGYKKFGERRMRAQGVPVYRLIYASKHERGLEFWEKVTKKDASGQGELF